MSIIAQLVAATGAPAFATSLSQGLFQNASSLSSNSHAFGANTATATGGAGGYSYQWTYSGDNGYGAWSITGFLTGPTVYVQVGNVYLHGTAQLLVACTVTDALGNTASAVTQYSYTYGSPA